MRICTVVVLMGIFMNGATSMTHTLREFWTYSCEVPNFPEYVSVGVLNEHMIYYFDSLTRRTVFKQEWMNGLIEEDPKIQEWRTLRDVNREQMEKGNFEDIKLRLNQTEGLHMNQVMTGCEWDDETDEIRGYYQRAFDGEDFLWFDWDSLTFVAAKSQAFAVKLLWQRRGTPAYVKNEVTHLCADYLKKFVQFGEKAIKRKELPLVSFLQKSSSSPVTCHATGFYPDRARLFWAKDGEELLEEDVGEILPNHDGTFQSSVSLDLSSVPTEDWGRYSCVFQLSGVKDDLITKLDPGLIRTNEKKLAPVIFAVSVSLAVAAVVVVAGVALYRKYKNNNVL